MSGRARTKRGTAIAAVLALIAGLVGVIAVESPAYAAKVPAPPASLTGVAGPGVGVMSLTWGSPPNLAAGAVVNYYVATSYDGGSFSALYLVGKLKKATVPCGAVNYCIYRVYANTKGGGTGAPATVTVPFTAPSSPTLVSGLGGPSVARMTLSWNPSVNTGGKAITSYLYDVQVNSTGPWIGPFALSGTPSSIQMPCSSTNPAGGCNYRVYARNSVGTSAPSAPLAAQWALPSAPIINSVTPGKPAHAVTINWKPGASTGGLANTYTYEVSTDAGPFVPGAGPLPAFPTIATVECNATTICSYRLKATSAYGASGVSNTLSTGFNAPTAARSVLARVADLNLGTGVPTVNVSWLAPVNLGGSPITRYEGRRCNGNCDESNAAWSSATIEPLGTSGSWLTTCPAGLTTCSYEVRAVNDIGPGPWGSSARVAPFAPTNVTASTAAPAGNVGVTWTGPAEVGQGIDHFTLYYCVTSAGCGNSSNWQDTGVAIPAGSQSASHNCGNGVQCTYKVAAVEVNSGASGASSASAAAAGSTPADAPQTLTAASGTSIGAVNLAWSAPANAGTFPVTDYVFQRSVNSGPFSAPISTGSTATTYTDPACGASNICTYQVAAVTLAGTGAYSNQATAEGANVPSAPLNLAATPGGTFGSVDLTWDPPLDNGGWPVSGYVLERSLDGGSTWPLVLPLGTSPSYTDALCGPGITCTYRVSATNARGTGPASNTATAVGTNLSPPLNLAASTSTTTLGGVLLSWDPPASDSGFTILGYEFRFKIGAGAFGPWADTGTLLGPRTFTHACGQDNTCTYEVRAYNAIGTSAPSNQASAQGLTDHTAPIVTVTTPTNGAAFTTSTPTISGTAGNALGDFTTVSVNIMQGATVIRTFTVTRSGTSWTVGPLDWLAGSPTSLANGTYTVTASQFDWAVNGGESAPVTFTVDSVPPTVAITSPADASIVSSSGTTYGESVWASGCAANTICGTAADGGSGVSSVKVSVQAVNTANTGINGLYWNPSTGGFTSGSEVFCIAGSTNCPLTGTTSWSVAFPIGNLPAGGAYAVRATSTDAAGNASAVDLNNFFVDYNPSITVFVSPSGSDLSTGLTPGLPKLTINSALTAAQLAGRSVAVVAAITAGTTYGGVTTASNTKTVRGGYDTSTWLRAAPGTRTVTISGAGTAVLVDGNTGIVLQQLNISGTSTGVAGSSVYGLRAINGANVSLQRVAVSAANATGTGTSGGNGSGNGGTGSVGTQGGTAGNNNVGFNGGTSGGGIGGRNGGTGGQGGYGNQTGFTGGNGIVSAGGGGNGGTGGNGTNDTGFSCGTDAGPGNPGGAGSGGSAPSGGVAGSNPLSGGTAAFPTGTAGGTGGTGTNGHGGGAGGGGGGEHNSICTDDHGGGGGGGGGAGGGGNSGTGGTNGGSSFGVYTFNSSVTIDANSAATAGNGANGGAGGAGSAGGSGAQAGKGGACDSGQEGGGGGTGGGGGGGSGGAGGGAGQGGHSIALYFSGSGTLTLSGTTTKGTAGSGGTAGAGGSGGAGGIAQTSGGRTSGSSGCNPGTAGPAGNTGATGGTGGSTPGSAFRIWNNGVTTP